MNKPLAKTPPKVKKAAAKKEEVKIGRPTIFCEELAALVCQRIAHGESLRAICREEAMPTLSTILAWVVDPKKKAFSEQYEKACDARAELIYEEIMEIADEQANDWIKTKKGDLLNKEAVLRSRLRVDARKWWLSKMRPKRFGDKLDVTSGGKELPSPILAHVPVHNRNEEGSEPQ